MCTSPKLDGKFQIVLHMLPLEWTQTHIVLQLASPWWCDALSVLGASLMIIKLYLFVILTTIFLIVTGTELSYFLLSELSICLIIFLLCCAFLFDIHIFWTNPLRMMYIASVFSSSHWPFFSFLFFSVSFTEQLFSFSSVY